MPSSAQKVSIPYLFGQDAAPTRKINDTQVDLINARLAGALNSYVDVINSILRSDDTLKDGLLLARHLSSELAALVGAGGGTDAWQPKVAVDLASIPGDNLDTPGSPPVGLQILDSRATGSGQRVLLKDQVDARYNGLYVTSLSGAWTRVADADTAAELGRAFVSVLDGRYNKGSSWVCAQRASEITLGTSNLTFARVGAQTVTPPPPAKSFNGLRQSMGVPAYATPGTPPTSTQPWATYIAAGSPTVDLVVFTPDAVTPGAGGQGPGLAPDPVFVAAVDAARAAGCRVCGYIRTLYTQRSLTAVFADIDNFFLFYNIDGIFIDEVDASPVSYEYYRQIREYLNTKPRNLLILNPGATPSEIFMQVADIIMSFESSYSVWLSSGGVPNWYYNYDPRRFWCAIHTCDSSAKTIIAMNLAKARGYGNIFITDDVMDYPYNALPTWWSTEVALLDSPVTPFTPKSIPGLQHWWTATDTIVSGALIGTATDIAPNAAPWDLTASGSLRPTKVAAALNGLPIMRFSGAQRLVADPAFELDEDFSFFIVGKINEDGKVFFGSTNATKVGVYRDAGKLSIAAGSFVDSDLTLPNAYVIITGTLGGYAGSRRKLYLNGVEATFDSPGTYNILKFALGAYYEGDNAANCDIEEIGFYNRPLKISEFAQLHNCLSVKTGITLGT